MQQTQRSNKSSSSSSSAFSASSDFMSDSLNSQTLDDDHLATDGVKTVADKKPLKVTTSLPGAKSADDGLEVADHTAIETRSKRNKNDKAFQAMDADYKLGFTFKGTDSYKERMKARGAYNRGEKGESKEQGEGYRVHIGKAGEKSNEKDNKLRKETGINTLADYQTMLKKDFNFGKIVSNFGGKGTDKERFDNGKDKFLAAVIARFYPGQKVGSPETQVAESIAINIWSYACRGQDVTGGTDIGELQGLLYVFDKQIQKSSDTNTKMSKGEENTFIVPGTEGTDHEIKLQKGDDRHGRATILTTRHLLADMTTKPKTSLGGFDMSYMLFDKSSSMQNDEYKKLSNMLGAGGINGKVALAGFDADSSTLAKVQDGKALTPKEAGTVLSTASTENTSQPANFSSPELNKGSGKVNNEQGMANALVWAESLPTKSDKVRQMVIVTDEPDFNPSILPKLQAIAKKKNLSVKVLYSYNKSQQNAEKQTFGGRSTNYVLVDIMKIKSAKEFEVTRSDVTKRNADGKFDSSCKEDTTQLDWGAAAKAQGAKEKEWK